VELAQIEAVVEVARQHSFTRAAQALFLTQPTISNRIQTLERDLGCSLFERRSRGVALTEEGRAFLPHAERTLQAVRDGLEALESSREATGGRLAIGSARNIGAYVLPPILESFRRRHPGVELQIRTGRSSDVLGMLLNDEVQIGFGRTLVHRDVRSFHIYDEEIALFVHPSHPFTDSTGVTVYEIGREPLILYDPGSTYYVMINRLCQEAGIAPRVTMQLDSIEATKKMIEQGLGVSLLPVSAVQREVEAVSLVQVPILDMERITLPTAIMYRRTRRPAGAVAAFLRLVEEIYARPIHETDEADDKPETVAAGAVAVAATDA
jgi:DNA-binding transcriptional LysR family regulator